MIARPDTDGSMGRSTHGMLAISPKYLLGASSIPRTWVPGVLGHILTKDTLAVLG